MESMVKADYLKRFLFWSLVALAMPAWSVDLTAGIGWSRQIELGSPTASGRIERVLVRPGQRVQEGELLVEFTYRTADLMVMEAKAMVASARSRLGEARREYGRALELYDRTVLSDRDKFLSEIGLLEAQQALAKAQAILQSRMRERDYRQITAPFSGLVLKVDAQPGLAVTNQHRIRPLVVLVDDQQLLAIGQVDATAASQLQPGQLVQVAVREQWLDARIDSIGLEPAASTGGGDQGSLYRLSVIFHPPKGMQLRAGELAVIRTGKK